MKVYMSQELIEDAAAMKDFMAYVRFDLEHPGVPTHTAVPRPGLRPWLYRLWCQMRKIDGQTLSGWTFIPTAAFTQFKQEYGL